MFYTCLGYQLWPLTSCPWPPATQSWYCKPSFHLGPWNSRLQTSQSRMSWFSDSWPSCTQVPRILPTTSTAFYYTRFSPEFSPWAYQATVHQHSGLTRQACGTTPWSHFHWWCLSTAHADRVLRVWYSLFTILRLLPAYPVQTSACHSGYCTHLDCRYPWLVLMANQHRSFPTGSHFPGFCTCRGRVSPWTP